MCVENSEAEELLVQQYLGLVISQAKRFAPNSVVDFEDYKQSAMIGLIKAYREYDPEKGKFESYAWKAIRNSILDEIRNAQSGSLTDIEQKEEVKISEWLPDLSKMEQSIIKMYGDGYNLSEIARALGISRTWAGELFDRAVEKIRKANRE